MSCFHPIDAWICGINPETGKKILTFSYDPYHENRELIQIPCGKCIGCRLDYSREWANRCMLELGYHESSYFVTLTYDDVHVPISYYADKETGEALPAMTLRKRDYQLFMKRLRKRFSDQHIRFYACGEYGGKTHRPHYHAILFGLKLDDLVLYKSSLRGDRYYNSASFNSCWQDHDGLQIGHCVIGEVTWNSCAYVARYVTKKLNGSMSGVYKEFNIEPEFVLMSRRPGIARQYFEDHPDLYEYDYISLSTDDGGRKIYPPRYYDKLFEVVHPDQMAEIKERRKDVAIKSMEAKLAKTSLDIWHQLVVEEDNLSAKIKSLRRDIV
uniref:Replication initiator protein n=2 Tax=unclassified Microvirus TaxID=338099 RepID=A0AAU8AX18_9VIRU